MLHFALAVVISAAAFLPLWLCDTTHEANRPTNEK